jgi:hypothetical protein
MTAPNALEVLDQWLWNERNGLNALKLELRFRKDRNIASLKQVDKIKKKCFFFHFLRSKLLNELPFFNSLLFEVVPAPGEILSSRGRKHVQRAPQRNGRDRQGRKAISAQKCQVQLASDRDQGGQRDSYEDHQAAMRSHK